MNLEVIELFPCFLPSKQNKTKEMKEIVNKVQTQRDRLDFQRFCEFGEG